MFMCAHVCVCVWPLGLDVFAGQESPDWGPEESRVAKIQIYYLTFNVPI